jgi:hypothetical protein
MLKGKHLYNKIGIVSKGFKKYKRVSFGVINLTGKLD